MPNGILNDTLDSIAHASQHEANASTVTSTEPKPHDTPETLVAKNEFDPCPECGKTDFYSARTRGSHMFWKHGIPGTSADSIAVRKKKAEQKKVEEKKHTKSRSHHKKDHHRDDSTVRPPEPTVDQTVAAHTLYLVGYLTHHIEQYCHTHNIPASTVTREVGVGLASRLFHS